MTWNCVLQEGETSSKTPMNNNNVSPQTSSKAMRKLTSSLRTRSPTGQSPSTKTRKPSGVGMYNLFFLTRLLYCRLMINWNVQKLFQIPEFLKSRETLGHEVL